MICPLCTSHAPKVLQKNTRDFHHCPICDLMFVPARQHLKPEDEAARYRLHNNTMANSGYVQMFTAKFPVLKHYWKSVHTVLDFGCGPGPVLVELLRQEGYEAEGYDPFFAPNTDLDRSYDAVISTEAFEHFAQPALEIQRITGMLPPGGYLAVMTRLRPRDLVFESWWYIKDPTHVAFYSTKTFSWIAQQFEFTMVYNNQRDFVILQRGSGETN